MNVSTILLLIVGHEFQSRTSLNFFQALFSLLFTYSFFDLQFKYAIFIYSFSHDFHCKLHLN